MSPIGQRTARLLTEQFYRWELRGRGWMIWPNPVRLEPPFRPFRGHFVADTPVVDDGRVESLGSRIAGFLMGGSSGTTPVASPPEDEDEPEAQRSRQRPELVELQLALPPTYEPASNVFQQFLFSIGYTANPVSFEVVGTKKEFVVQIAVDSDEAELIRRQLKAFFPEAVITSCTGHLSEILLEAGDGDFEVVDFGLDREFMVPIHGLKALAVDPLVALCGAMDGLADGEVGVFQVLLDPVQNPWAPSMLKAVTQWDGKPFFANAPELVDQARLKASKPLFSVVLRVAALAETRSRCGDLLRSLSGGLRPLAATEGNQLIPLNNDDYPHADHVEDLLARTTRRSGMLLNSDELVALVHLPTAAVRSTALRRALQKTRPAPTVLTRAVDGIVIGDNLHEGVRQPVHLPMEARLNHCHILGGTGSGKSTLLGTMALQDILFGHGVAVIDPHGDLIDALLPHIPAERLDDVILFDPSDSEYAFGFNPLVANTVRERELLASDFVAVMRQHTSGWGDQMSSLLGNALLAFLQNSRVGTLLELRRFLAIPGFRGQILATVTNPEVAYFWEHESALAHRPAIGSILVRLDELLRSESLLHILGQRANRLDFAEVMDSGKIFLARLSKGLIGDSNAYLLGGLLVSKFYQTAIARQSIRREERKPYMLLMDEAGELLTSTISEILAGTRKYGLGLTLAHQSLRQLTGDDGIYGAVTGSTGTKICFQVGGDDARKMAEEFAGFEATDLMNLKPLYSVARVGPRSASFNLEVQPIPKATRPTEEAHTDLLARTRQRYGTPKAEIRKEIEALRDSLPKRAVTNPFGDLTKRQRKERETRTEPNESAVDPIERASAEPTGGVEPVRKPLSSTTDAPPSREVSELADAAMTAFKAQEPARSGPSPGPQAAEPVEKLKTEKSEAIKNTIIQTCGSWGFSVETEAEILNGTGRVDMVLRLADRTIAVEIAHTSPAGKEVIHLLNCFSAGFTEIVSLCDHTTKRRQIEALLRSKLIPGQERYFSFRTVHQFQTLLTDYGEATLKFGGAHAGDKAPSVNLPKNPEELEALTKRMLAEIAVRKARAKSGDESP